MLDEKILDKYGIQIEISFCENDDRDDTIICGKDICESEELDAVKYYYENKVAIINFQKLSNSGTIFYDFFKKDGEYWFWIKRYCIHEDFRRPIVFINLSREIIYENIILEEYESVTRVKLNQSGNTLAIHMAIPGYRADHIFFADFSSPINGCELKSLSGNYISHIWAEDDEPVQSLEDSHVYYWNGDIFIYKLRLLSHSVYGYISDWDNHNINEILNDEEMDKKLSREEIINVQLVRENDRMKFKEIVCTKKGEEIFNNIFNKI